MLSLLSTLEEDDREEYVKWRGKILQVGFVSNIWTEEGKDSDIVNLVVEKIRAWLHERSRVMGKVRTLKTF